MQHCPLARRLDGRRAAPASAVLHNALGYAVEIGLLDANPADRISGWPPRACEVVDPRVVASAVQVRALLAVVGQIRPDLKAFFGCLYYAALRPEEAIALRQGACPPRAGDSSPWPGPRRARPRPGPVMAPAMSIAG